jgi:arylsulfatase A-like enzyme
MVRTDRWKLIITPAADIVQLFDIESDPWELQNLAVDPKSDTVMGDLTLRLKR